MDEKVVVNTEPIQQMLQRLGASAVFGEPTTQNGVVIIPVAQTQLGFGYGGGYGSGGKVPMGKDVATGGTDEGIAGGGGSGGGSGGGAGARSTPRGFIRISADEVKFEPIIDETRIPLAGIVMAAWVVFWVMATIRAIAKAVAKSQQAKWRVAKAENTNH